jgi:hypothetical protein
MRDIEPNKLCMQGCGKPVHQDANSEHEADAGHRRLRTRLDHE